MSLNWQHNLVISALAIFALSTVTRAEPVVDRALSSVQLVKNRSCPTVMISFNFRVRYVSHFPIGGGREVRIRIRPIDRQIAKQILHLPTEALRAPTGAASKLRAIEFERGTDGPTLHLFFGEKVQYHVSQGSNFNGIEVMIAGPGASKSCRKFNASLINTGHTGKQNVAKGKTGLLEGDLSKKTSRSKRLQERTNRPGATMKQARKAFARKNYDLAVNLLRPIVDGPYGKYSRKAQELLGLAYERKGRLAHARAEYRIYLKKYPRGKGAARVRQRLAGIETANSAPKAKMAKTKPARARSRVPAKIGTTTTRKTDLQTRQPGKNTRLNAKGDLLDSFPKDHSDWTWRASGSLSQFYFRSQGVRKINEFASRRKTIENDVYNNTLLTGLDFSSEVENQRFRISNRFSGAHIKDFETPSHGRKPYSVSSLYLQAEDKKTRLKARIGRQSRNSGGVLGRFDGGLFSWKANDMYKLNLVAGSPVDRSYDKPFLYSRYFTGVSLDIGPLVKGWDTTVYFLNQQAGSLVDRRVIGLDYQYFDPVRSLFGTLEYDIYFQRLTAAIVSGTWTFSDKSTLTISADYLYSPSLSTMNALQGQKANSLSELKKLFTSTKIRQLALDRTIKSKSATISYSRPINDKLQISGDVTVFHTSGMPASGGVPTVASTGIEWFLSTQLVANDVLTDGDMFFAGLRYANTFTSQLYFADFYSRYRVSEKMRVRPRLRGGYRNMKKNTTNEFFIMPSLTTNFDIGNGISLEFDGGARWMWRQTAIDNERDAEVFFTLGLRYDFQKNGKF